MVARRQHKAKRNDCEIVPSFVTELHSKQLALQQGSNTALCTMGVEQLLSNVCSGFLTTISRRTESRELNWGVQQHLLLG